MRQARTLPPIDHHAHREAFRSRLGTDGLTALLVTAPANVRYLSGFSGSNGQLLLGADRADDRLITDDRYLERAATEAPGLEVVLSRDPLAVAVDAIRGDTANLGFEADHLTWQQGERIQELAAAAGLQATPTTALLTGARSVKTAEELARLEQACAITVEALAWLLIEVAAPGRTERELATALERRFVDLGADGVAFPSIVAAGPNGAVPHHAPTDRPLAAGELLTVDCGALVDGYHADCTRTIAIGGVDDIDAVPGDVGAFAGVLDLHGTLDAHDTLDRLHTLRAVHELVREAQAAGRAAATAGATAGAVDAAAREVIEAAGYGERFVHGTGHGVGLEIHEAPAVARGARATLAAGTALTVEPGIYLPGVGGVRIEDTIVVTADGPARILTDLSRELRP